MGFSANESKLTIWSTFLCTYSNRHGTLQRDSRQTLAETESNKAIPVSLTAEVSAFHLHKKKKPKPTQKSVC